MHLQSRKIIIAGFSGSSITAPRRHSDHDWTKKMNYWTEPRNFPNADVSVLYWYTNVDGPVTTYTILFRNFFNWYFFHLQHCKYASLPISWDTNHFVESKIPRYIFFIMIIKNPSWRNDRYSKKKIYYGTWPLLSSPIKVGCFSFQKAFVLLLRNVPYWLPIASNKVPVILLTEPWLI